ncbi:unnamed protein product [Rotaria socialis]|uniref:Calpain catalytic domain-containing protein n=1 Tax=Rotaria socialis TaxID=392032 RepID=A0A818YEQ5_9BILA|nr:unnamed protein product [Rotaria socialis]CAF4557871.1 unnamed protein product [Rotaria socialis]
MNLNQRPMNRTYRLENSSFSNQSAKSSRNLVNTKGSPTTSISLAIDDRRHSDETNAEKLFTDIVLFCQQENTHFVDDQFPPIARSIGYIDALKNYPLQWLRISEISPSSQSDLRLKWSVYSSPKPSDIQQGTLGDCWLMAALALITERPQMLEHILLIKKINNQGVYLVRICHNGLWKTVIVDDCFPCTQYNQLAFTQAHRRQLYVPLIEKACAKLFGSYADLISGQTEEGLQLLTGAPCDHIDLNSKNHTIDSEMIWAKLLSACESHLLIGASTGRSDISAEEYTRNNIPSNHAFSVLAAHSLSNISMQFVLVRDPHARSNYSDESITPYILTKLNNINRDYISPGAFWISWPKFLRFFNSITISSYATDYFDIREVNRFTRSSTQLIPTYHFHLSKTSLVNISLIYHRENRRIRNTHTQSFVLCNVEQGPSKDVGTRQAILCTSRGAFTHWIGSLTSGFYVLIPFSTSFWNDDHQPIKDYTLVMHSKVQINVQVTPEPAALLADCLIASVLKNNIPPQRGKDYTYYVTTNQYDFIMFVAENLSPTDFLNLEIDSNDSRHVRNSRKSLSTFDCIPPRHRQITFLIEWTTNEQGQKAKMDYLYRSQHVKQSNPSVPEIYNIQNNFHSFRPF